MPTESQSSYVDLFLSSAEMAIVSSKNTSASCPTKFTWAEV